MVYNNSEVSKILLEIFYILERKKVYLVFIKRLHIVSIKIMIRIF